MKMDTELKTEWVKRLRSGDYEQGRGYLCSVDTDGNKAFCCLGVLSDIAAERGIVDKVDGKFGTIMFGEQQVYLPEKVQEWSGIPFNGAIDQSERHIILANLNDRGSSFDEIADIIEEEF